MSGELRHWQTKIWIGEKFDQPVTLHAESLIKLQTMAAAWLKENKLLEFGNASPDYEFSKRVNYAYSDGTRKAAFPLRSFWRGETLEEGWHYVEGAHPSSLPTHADDFEHVVEHFVRHAMIPEKGPDYKEVALVEGNLQLHRIKTIRREKEEIQVSDMLQRGWYIIALEYEGKTDYLGERLVSRKAVFVLGHPEENAI